jgi:hypothetical protein
MKIKLTGTQGTQISTPDGMVVLNRNGEAILYKQSTQDFICERIKAGGLAGFELEEVPEPSEPSDTDDKKKPKA